jgi:hypothetical protein
MKKIWNKLTEAFQVAFVRMRIKDHVTERQHIRDVLLEAVRSGDKKTYCSAREQVTDDFNDFVHFSAMRNQLVVSGDVSALSNLLKWDREFGRDFYDRSIDDILRNAQFAKQIAVLEYLVDNDPRARKQIVKSMVEQQGKGGTEHQAIAEMLAKKGIDLVGETKRLEANKPPSWEERKRRRASKDF